MEIGLEHTRHKITRIRQEKNRRQADKPKTHREESFPGMGGLTVSSQTLSAIRPSVRLF
jgi:hypothetical protein